MRIVRHEPRTPLPCPRGYTASMRIRSFKGRRDVQVHLFRPVWDAKDADLLAWELLISVDDVATNRGDSKKVILETFTLDELEAVLEYVSQRYADRLENLTSSALSFPIPTGLLPLCAMPEGKDMGRIRFDIVPGYTLPFIVHGWYDLSQHKPINDGLDAE